MILQSGPERPHLVNNKTFNFDPDFNQLTAGISYFACVHCNQRYNLIVLMYQLVRFFKIWEIIFFATSKIQDSTYNQVKIGVKFKKLCSKLGESSYSLITAVNLMTSFYLESICWGRLYSDLYFPVTLFKNTFL